MSRWETVIGLEVHVQLATASKLFCGCATRFGDPPNSHVCPVCLGLPGALPVPNEAAVRLGVRAALVLGCTVHPRSIFARKNYFYPDLPKGYQISQFDRPLATGGSVTTDLPGREPLAVGITRLHLEEDAGKLVHDRIPDSTAVDLNRAGTPLAEIVTEPDLRSPAEARAFLTTLKQLLLYAEVSECSMEKGSLRVDANVSLRQPGATELGTKTELKNMNSFANVERAIEVEQTRQAAILERGDAVEQMTLLFDPGTGQVRSMRSKEESHDYRYFPDPDLPPLVIAAEAIGGEQAALPELPASKRRRYRELLGLTGYDAGVITADRTVASYFEATLAAGAPVKVAANWVMGDVMAKYNETATFPVGPDSLARLIALVEEGALSLQAARKVFAELVSTTEAPAQVAARLGLIQVRDRSALASWVDEVIAGHPAEVGRYRGGEGKLLGFLVGQVIKRSRGAADPKAVTALLTNRLSRSSNA
jgi:aspartyl-tRNA(Asn)/glutamyl-tRNA(Gln) amidotransferase subunit B